MLSPIATGRQIYIGTSLHSIGPFCSGCKGDRNEGFQVNNSCMSVKDEEKAAGAVQTNQKESIIPTVPTEKPLFLFLILTLSQ